MESVACPSSRTLLTNSQLFDETKPGQGLHYVYSWAQEFLLLVSLDAGRWRF